MIQTQIAVVVSGEAFQSAAWDRVIQQFSGCADRGLLLAAKNDMYLGLRIPKSRLYGIGTVALQERDHIFFADLAGIPVIIIEQLLRNAQAKVHIVFGSKEQSSIRTSGKLLNRMIPDSTLESLPGYRHGDLSLNHPQAYAQKLLTMIR